MTDHSLPEPVHLLLHLSPRDRQLFRTFGWGPRETVPHQHIHHAFEAHAASYPDALAAEHLGTHVTYGELNRQANQLAATLVAFEVRPGDHVGLFVRRSIHMLVGILGILKAGAAYVPQDVDLAPTSQLQHVIRIAAPKVILTLSEHAAKIPATNIPILSLDKMPLNSTENIPDAIPNFILDRPLNPDSGCYILFTSGTTGKPNGVTVTHRNICNILLTSPGDLHIQPGWRVAQILNVAFDMAAWEILGCLSHGGTLVIRGKDISAITSDVDVVIATPTILSTLDMNDCPRVKVVAVAGEPCPRSLADLWARRTTFYNSCGPTETTIVNTMQQHVPSSLQLTIGRPTPNNTVYILDDNQQPLPIGDVGELWAGGDCVSAGYLANSELNTERYTPDPFANNRTYMFRTRDLGRWTPWGEIEHLGRTDDQVKVRGFRVELDSVSAVLESVPGVTRAVTLKLDDRSLISFVASEALNVDPDTARQTVSDTLPYYCVPVAVQVLTSLPETNRGKIDKAALLHLYTSQQVEIAA